MDKHKLTEQKSSKAQKFEFPNALTAGNYSDKNINKVKIMKSFFVFTAAILSLFFASAQDTTAVDNNTDSTHLKTQADSIIDFAKQQIGVGYTYAGSTPETGFDCSGFVTYVFKKFGYKLPRSSKYYGKIGTKIALKNCKKGDIILFAGYNPKKRPIGHVGIIVENNKGDIKFIHSATSKRRGVVISHYNSIKYYTQRFVGIRRVIKE